MRMRFFASSALAALLSISPFSTAMAADSVLVASAAGYRKPLVELIENFHQHSSTKIEASFGHMKQIETQAQQNPDIAILIGDEKFLRPMALTEQYLPLGQGKLTLIYKQGLSLNALDDLKHDQVTRIVTPDQKRAIYGAAAIECLKEQKLFSTVENKLVEADTVPQVGTYVALSEADAGFVNLTEALAQGDKIGGYVVAPDNCYEPVIISAAVLPTHQDQAAVQEWLQFLQSDAAKAILKKYGLD